MFVAALVVQSLSAQDNNRQRMTTQQRTEQRIKKLDEKLVLTDEQESKIRELYANFNKQKYSKDKRKEAMGKLIADITAVLTPEQQELYKQMQEEASAERRKNKPGKDGNKQDYNCPLLCLFACKFQGFSCLRSGCTTFVYL